MLQTPPSSSRFWPNWLAFGGCFQDLILNLMSLTFYQHMVEFSGCPNHFDISNQLTFLVARSHFYKCFLQIVSRSSLSNILPTYGADQLILFARLANFRRWFLQSGSTWGLSNLQPIYGDVFKSFHECYVCV